MDDERKIITAAEMDKMTPQERADAIDARIIRDWAHVGPEFQQRVLEEARRLGSQVRGDG